MLNLRPSIASKIEVNQLNEENFRQQEAHKEKKKKEKRGGGTGSRASKRNSHSNTNQKIEKREDVGS